MGVNMYFRSGGPVPAEVAEAVRSECEQLGVGRRWVHCGPVGFYPDTGDGRLVGFSKLNLHPDPAEYADAAREPAGTPDLQALLDQLADWSDRFRLTWELDVEGHKLGGIVNGEIDAGLIEALEALSAVADELAHHEPLGVVPADDGLFPDPADEDEPPAEGYHPRLFRPDGG